MTLIASLAARNMEPRSSYRDPIPSGEYGAAAFVVIAEMDAQGTGQPNANNPFGATAPVTISGANVTANVVLTDPVTPPAAVAPTGLSVVEGSGTAAVLYTPNTDANGQETATSYQITWGTDVAATNGGTAYLAAQGTNQKVYFLRGLTGTNNYAMSACVGGTIACSGGALSTASSAVAAASPAGPNTVSGTVSYTGTVGGPMYVVIHNNASGTAFQAYITSIAAPTNPQPYSIAGVPNGSWYLTAIVDNNNDGRIDAGDFNNANGRSPLITVNGNTPGNLTLSSANATVTISTEHSTDGVVNNYQNHTTIGNGVKQVASVTLFSGPNVAVPLDVGYSYGSFNIGLETGGVRPLVGDAYQFLVIYSDLTFEVLSGSVTGVLDSFATALTVTPTPSANIPTFTWAAPTSPPTSYGYAVNVFPATGGNGWYYSNNTAFGLPSSTLSVVYNVDGLANPASLVTGTAYKWQVRVIDAANGNTATYQPATAWTP